MQYPRSIKGIKRARRNCCEEILRLHVKDEIGVFAKITSLFSERGVSFEKIIQMPLEEKGKAEIVIVTHRASLADYDYILHTLQGYEEIDCVKANYRIEGDAK